METDNLRKVLYYCLIYSEPQTFAPDLVQSAIDEFKALLVAQQEPAIVMCSDLIHEVRKVEDDDFCKTCGKRL